MRDQNQRNRNGEPVRSGDAVVTLVAYARMPDGRVSLSDDFLATFYERARRDGIIDAVWRDKADSNEKFIGFMHSALADPPGILPIFAFEDMQPVGLAWLTDLGPVNAFAHFAFLKTTWGRNSRKIAHDILAHWFSWRHIDDRPLLQVIIGSTPNDNMPALAFIRRLGFTVVGEIPYLADGKPTVISYLTQERFEADSHVQKLAS